MMLVSDHMRVLSFALYKIDCELLELHLCLSNALDKDISDYSDGCSFHRANVEFAKTTAKLKNKFTTLEHNNNILQQSNPASDEQLSSIPVDDEKWNWNGDLLTYLVNEQNDDMHQQSNSMSKIK